MAPLEAEEALPEAGAEGTTNIIIMSKGTAGRCCPPILHLLQACVGAGTENTWYIKASTAKAKKAEVKETRGVTSPPQETIHVNYKRGLNKKSPIAPNIYSME